GLKTPSPRSAVCTYLGHPVRSCNMRSRYSPLLLALLACGPLVGCLEDAARGNPFHPLSDNYRDAGEVTGSLVRASRPSAGVPEARVPPRPAGAGPEILADVQADGASRPAAVPAGEYTLTAEATGYTPADTAVAVTAAQPPQSVVLALNAIPYV